MSWSKHIIATSFLFVALAGINPVAAQEGPMPPSKPPVENEGLKMFVGSWTCAGTAMTGPGKTEKVKATAKVKNELGGFWQSFVYTELKTKEYPMAITAIGTWGWESVSKKFVRSEFQSNGGYVLGTSTGWTGDTMTWDLELSSFMGKMTARHSFTKKGDKEFVHKLVTQMPGNSGPTTLFEVTCKK
jgi:hypothetical protein